MIKKGALISCLMCRVATVDEFSSTGINIPESACIIANEEKAYLLIGIAYIWLILLFLTVN